MYLYFKPWCGFNDDLSRIIWMNKFCTECGRVLLLDGERGTYAVDYSKLMTFPGSIIYDTKTVDNVLKKYPLVQLPFINCNASPTAVQDLARSAGNHPLVTLRIRHIGTGYPLFRCLGFLPTVKAECQRRRNLLGDKYICIQVRNTDRKCDYIGLYNANREAIHSYPAVYLATDCEEVLTFFNKKLPVKNFAVIYNLCPKSFTAK